MENEYVKAVYEFGRSVQSIESDLALSSASGGDEGDVPGQITESYERFNRLPNEIKELVREDYAEVLDNVLEDVIDHSENGQSAREALGNLKTPPLPSLE